MRETSAICAFLLSTLVFSSFTPFAYSFEEKAAPVAAAVGLGVAGDALELQDAECSTNTLTVAEYKKLLAFANESIDFLGNKQAELDAQEKVKRGITPEAPEAEGRMVMGTDKPIPIADVVGREAMFQNGTCFLKNSAVRGRLAYAALLDRNYRICLNATNPNCMAGALGDEQKADIKARLEQFSKSLLDVTNKTEAQSVVETERAELEKVKFSPLNYMTTQKGYLGTSSADSIFMLPQTLGIFINWLKGFETWDKLAGYAAIAGLGVGVAQVLKGGIRYLRWFNEKPFGIGTFTNQLKSFITRARDTKVFKAKFEFWKNQPAPTLANPAAVRGVDGVRAEVKDLLIPFGNPDDELDGIKKLATAIKGADPETAAKITNQLNTKLGRLEKIRIKLESKFTITDNAGIVQVDASGNPLIGVAKRDAAGNLVFDANGQLQYDPLQLYEEITKFRTLGGRAGLKTLEALDLRGAVAKSDALSFLRNMNERLSAAGLASLAHDAGGIDATTGVAYGAYGDATLLRESADDATAIVKSFIDKAKGTPAAVDIIKQLGESTDAYRGWLVVEGDVFVTDGAKAADEMLKIFDSARETSIALEASSDVFTSKITGATWGNLPPRLTGFIGKAGIIATSGKEFWDVVRRSLGSGFRWASAQTMVLESTMILTNALIRKPILETQGIQFDMDNTRAILGDNPYFQIDVLTPFTRSDALPHNWLYDTFVAYGLSIAFPETAFEKKLQQIGDYVYIHDTASLKPGLTTGEDAVALITEVNIADYGKREMIFSKTPGNLLVLAFEHPKDYLDGWTAMALESHDINLLALTDKVESWALTPFENGMDFLGSTVLAFAAGSFIGGVVGGVITGGRLVWFLKAAIVGAAYVNPLLPVTPTIARETKELFQGQLVDVKKAKESTTSCSKIYEDKKTTVWLAKNSMYATLGASFVPVPVVGITGAALNILATYWAEKEIGDTISALHECAETDFNVVAVKKSNPQLLKDDLTKNLVQNPAVKSIADSMSTITPDIAKELNKAIAGAQEQTLNLRGELGDTTTRVLPQETYYLYLYKAAIDWFKLGMGCDMQVCSKKPSGAISKCWSITDTTIKDDAGNTVLEKEHVRGFRIDKEMKYAYLPQKVINVKIGDGKKILEVDSSGVSISGCLKSEVKGLLKTTSEDLLKRSFGRLDAIATKEAAVVFDNGKNLQVQFLEPYCDQNAGGWVSIPNGKVEIYADAAGTVKVPGLKDNAGKECDLHIPIGSAASFENALVMPGLKGDVYNIMIYGLVEEDIGNLESFKTSEMCRLEDGTPGVKLSTTFRDPAMTQQYGDLLKDICMTQIKGQQNETINFLKGADGKDYMDVTDASGKTKRYQVIGYGTAMCKDSMEVNDIDTNVRQCFRGYKDPNGVPTYGFFDNSGRQVGAPIPMFWSNGLGGMMLYNPDTGKISINNAFPFSMNPAFNTLGMMTTPYGTGLVPGLPPGGNPNAGRGTGGTGVQPNLLASLPWTPQGPELVIFLIAIAGMLIAIRIRNPERKRR